MASTLGMSPKAAGESELAMIHMTQADAVLNNAPASFFLNPRRDRTNSSWPSSAARANRLFRAKARNP